MSQVASRAQLRLSKMPSEVEAGKVTRIATAILQHGSARFLVSLD
jgi:hypothetical protein